MGKNVEMLKVFFGVMSGKCEGTVIPLMYASDVYSIDYEFLYERGIDCIIFDIDNTILPVNDVNVPLDLVDFFKKLKKKGFNILIVSNNSKERVLPVAGALDVDFLFNACKPNKVAFDKALDKLDASKDRCVMVGDQMLSDIRGANDYGIYSVLVEPLCDKYDVKTGTSRILQKIMVKRLKKRGLFTEGCFYKEER